MAKRKPVIHKREGKVGYLDPFAYWIKCLFSKREIAENTSHTWAGTTCLNCLRLKPKGSA